MAGPWQLQEAKNRFSELVNRAINDGPQIITRNGVETAVVLSLEDFGRLRQREGNLADFLAQSPLKGADLDLERSQDDPRELDL